MANLHNRKLVFRCRPARFAVWVYIACTVLSQPSPLIAAESKHFLWYTEIGESEVYLLGSIHAADQSFYPMAPVIEEAFRESDRLFLELDLGEVKLAEVQQKMLQRALYTDGRTLKDEFSAAEFDGLRASLGHFGLELDQMLPFKPWFVSLTLSQVFVEAMGLDMASGIDSYFYFQAMDSKMVYGLETMDMQLDMLSAFDMELQKELLLYTVEDLENFSQEMETLIEIWRRGDAAAMDAMLREPLEENPEFNEVYEKIFTERNIRMVRKLERLAQRYPSKYFVVVGAGHLVGDEGMVDLLRAKGYSVEQL